MVIPAAGCGTRLAPYTDRLPKCLIEIGGATILSRLLRRLDRGRVGEVIIVVGYLADLVEEHVRSITDRPPVSFVRNHDYRRANSIVSVLATADRWDDDFAIVDSDLLVSQRVLDSVTGQRGDAMVVDVGRHPAEVDMAVELRGGRIWDLDKEMPRRRQSGESLPLSRWTVDGGRELRAVMERMVEEGDDTVWYQYAMREVAKSRPVRPIFAGTGDWIEIDRPEDLVAAMAQHRNGAPWTWS